MSGEGGERPKGALLEAPCVFCGYAGAGYYQRDTHKPACPWRDVGGLFEREQLLPKVVAAAFARPTGEERLRGAAEAVLNAAFDDTVHYRDHVLNEALVALRSALAPEPRAERTPRQAPCGTVSSLNCTKHQVPMIATMTEETLCAVCERSRADTLQMVLESASAEANKWPQWKRDLVGSPPLEPRAEGEEK